MKIISMCESHVRTNGIEDGDYGLPESTCLGSCMKTQTRTATIDCPTCRLLSAESPAGPKSSYKDELIKLLRGCAVVSG
jgi:hypothetical protein